MKRFIFLLFFIPLGCSVESSAVQETPTIVESEPAIVENINNKDCATEPLLKIYEEFVELGIKEANLTTEKASISFSKRQTPKIEIKNNLTSEFGSAFLKDACALDGLVISMKDIREGYLGAYQLTFNSEKSAVLAANIIKESRSKQLKVFKVATVFDWRLSKNTILINYNSPATTIYYDYNVAEFSK